MTLLDSPPLPSRIVERLLVVALAVPLAGGLVLASGTFGDAGGPVRHPATVSAEPRVGVPHLQHASLAEARPLDLRALEAAAARMAQAPTFNPMPTGPTSGPIPAAPAPPQPPAAPSPIPQMPGVPAPPPPQQRSQTPSPVREAVLSPVRVADARTLEANGQRFPLADLVIPGGRACAALSGEAVDCGARAATQLSLFLEHRTVTCRGADTFACTVGSTDIGEWMVRRGLALPDGERYTTAAAFARAHKLGVWSTGGRAVVAQNGTLHSPR